MDTTLLPNEVFKPHPKFPIEASNFGRIKFKGKILLQRPYGSKRYPYGYLWEEIPDISKQQWVYKLVAETWCERPDAEVYREVHHISNNGIDNRPENLLWVTKEQHAEIHPWLKNLTKKTLQDKIVPDGCDLTKEEIEKVQKMSEEEWVEWAAQRMSCL